MQKPMLHIRLLLLCQDLEEDNEAYTLFSTITTNEFELVLHSADYFLGRNNGPRPSWLEKPDFGKLLSLKDHQVALQDQIIMLSWLLLCY
jgi:hypothetical protein